MNDRPRQYFPGEDGPNPAQQDYNQQPQDAQQPEGYYDFLEDESVYPAGGGYDTGHVTGSDGNGLTVTLGIIAALALLAAGALLFLWRSSAAEADKEPPPPVTETVTETETEMQTETQTETETETTTVTENPIPDVSDLPEVPEDPDEVEDWINDLFGQRQ